MAGRRTPITLSAAELGQGPGRAKELVTQFGRDTEEPVHVRGRGRRLATPVVGRAGLGDQAGEPARRGDNQRPRWDVAGRRHHVSCASGNEEVITGSKHGLAPACPDRELPIQHVDLLGVRRVAVQRGLRAWGEPAFDEVVSASGSRLSRQDTQAGAEGANKSSS